MAYVDPIELEEASSESSSSSASLPVVETVDEDTSFQSLLNSETAATAVPATTNSVKEASDNVSEKATILAEDDTLENRMEFLWSVDLLTDEVEEELTEADLSDSEDVQEIAESSDELDDRSDDLKKQSDEASDEETAEILEVASDITGDAGDILGSIAEVSETDPEKGAELAEEALIGLKEVNEALKGGGTPLENLQNAQDIMRSTHGNVMTMFLDIMGFTYSAAVMETITDSAEEDENQQRAIQDMVLADRSKEGYAAENASNVAVTTGGLSASTGVDLSGWKLTLPADHDGDGEADEIEEDELKSFRNSPNIVHNADGSITFSSATDAAATTSNSKYPRSELREMIRDGDTSIDTSALANNWVTSAAPADEQAEAGGVDGQMQATLSVDRVTVDGDAEQAGRVVIGQVHAENDEPVRLYYHMAPGSEKGSIYFAHEPQNGNPETFHVLIGNQTGTSSDGIALGEAFTYNIDITGTDLTVSVIDAEGQQYSESLDISESGYADPGTQMYFKAGVYSQNDSTPDPSTDYAEATFYSLATAHDGEALSGGSNPSNVFEPGEGSGEPSNFDDLGELDDPETYDGSSDPVDTSSPTISPESSTDYAASDANQEALEIRFQNLYVSLMEKQISFKEAVEAYKTDNQNAGKG